MLWYTADAVALVLGKFMWWIWGLIGLNIVQTSSGVRKYVTFHRGGVLESLSLKTHAPDTSICRTIVEIGFVPSWRHFSLLTNRRWKRKVKFTLFLSVSHLCFSARTVNPCVTLKMEKLVQTVTCCLNRTGLVVLTDSSCVMSTVFLCSGKPRLLIMWTWTVFTIYI